MDVGYYLSELLQEHNEVNVPGLGYFVRLRLDGYYNSDEGVFYPPRHQVQFDPQFIEDDILTRYIADNKNISLASSKYFTEKFINNLTQEALNREVQLAGLGWLYFDQRIRFKPADANDPEFYGLTPLAVEKLTSTSILDELQAIAPKPWPVPEPVILEEPGPIVPPEPIVLNEQTLREEAAEPQPEIAPQVEMVAQEAMIAPPEPATLNAPAEVFNSAADDQEEFVFRGKTYSGDDERKRNPFVIILVVLLTLLLLAVGALFSLYKFKPATFHRLMGQKPPPIILKIPLRHDTIKTITPVIKPDTGKKTAPVIVDTTIRTPATVQQAPTATEPAAVTDTFARVRYEISGGAFKKLAEANAAIKTYKRLGFGAKIIQNAPGKLYKLTLGTYFTKKEAVKAEENMLNTGKVSTKTIGIQPYYPKININK